MTTPAQTPATPTPTPKTAAPRRQLPICWGDQLAAAAKAGPEGWLWFGYLGRGLITLLTSQWKIGKSTLMAVLLAKLRAGGLLAELAVSPARAIILSEENAAIWNERGQALKLGRHVGFLFNPFAGKPSFRQWLRLLRELHRLHDADPFHLLVIDPLANFLPGLDENNAAGMIQKLQPLKRLARRGVAILLLHHPKKSAGGDGNLARGSGALPAFADIIIEMRWAATPSRADRRRKLTAFSRYADTPASLVLELNEAGTDYTTLGTANDLAYAATWAKLAVIFQRAEKKLSRKQVFDRLQEEQEDTVNPITLWRWLERAVEEKKLCRQGAGGNGDSPFRYWLPGQEETWAKAEAEADMQYMLKKATEMDRMAKQMQAMGLR